MAQFADATEVRPDNGGYTVHLDPEWAVNGNPHGGYLLATLARAAMAADRVTMGADRAALAADSAPVSAADGDGHPHPLSASAVYLSPPAVGPATIAVERLRRGRAVSQVRARLVQTDRVCVEALFTVGRLDAGNGPVWVDTPPPDVAPPADCLLSPVEPPGGGVRVAMLDMVEQRLDPASFASGRGGRAENGTAGNRGGSGDMRGWLSFADGTPFDPVSLLYAADSFPPATLTLGSVGWVPTLELTVYVRAVPAPGPLRIRQRVRLLSGELVDQVCDIWDTEDRLVAQATQLALVRLRTG